MSNTINPITETNLGKIWHRGKVRDTYEINNNQLLMISTDRISAFDVVLNDPIPGKGIILTEMSKFWFSKLSDVVNNHFANIPTSNDIKGISKDELSRGIIANKANRIDIECVVRGYLAGSGWKEYQADETVCGIKLPSGLVESSKLNEPIFTPSTKAEIGHDEDISREDILKQNIVKEKDYIHLENYTRALFKKGTEMSTEKGLILVDTKYEFGKDSDGNIVLIDEVHTCDSRRYWVKSSYQDLISQGKEPEKLDKDSIRDYVKTVCDPYDTSNLTNFTWGSSSGPDNLPIRSQSLRNSYKDCINKGFTKEFCLKTDSPNTCECSEGYIGIYLPGQRGKCI